MSFLDKLAILGHEGEYALIATRAGGGEEGLPLDAEGNAATLAGNPRQLHWVERDPGIGFTVNLTSAPPRQRPQTPFTYLIVEPAVAA